MKHFYYFSSKKLKFVEIKHFNKKLIVAISAFSFILSFFALGAYIKFTKRTDIEYLKAENKELISQLGSMINEYDELGKRTDSVSEAGNILRLSANLDTLTPEDREIGIGGKIFNEILPLASAESEAIVNELTDKYENLSARINFQKNNIEEIQAKLAKDDKVFRNLPALKPVDAEVGDGFGLRFHPILKIRRMHNGLDFRCTSGEDVFASADGKVSFAGRRGGYGRTIEIDHGNGYKSLYAHLYRIKVKQGDVIKRGDLIALSGNSGSLSTGPHLHYEIKHNGVTQNPYDYFYSDISPQEYNKAVKAKKQ